MLILSLKIKTKTCIFISSQSSESHVIFDTLWYLILLCSQVNEIDLRQATHDEAIGVLRLTTQRVRLCVFRHQEAYKEEDLWDVFSLELRPCPGDGLGLTTVGKWYGHKVD